MAARRTRNAIADPETGLRPETDYTDKGSTWDAAESPRKRRRNSDGTAKTTAAERRILTRLNMGKKLTPKERSTLAAIRSRD